MLSKADATALCKGGNIFRTWTRRIELHLLYCDESNLAEKSGDFLIYGGLMVEAEQALAFSLSIDRLRKARGVPPEYRLKFNPGPEAFTHEQFVELKQEIISLAIAHGARLLVYLILHDIAKSPDEARRNGINTVCYHFQCLLERAGGAGLVLIDRFNDEGNAIEAHLREKFTTGITGLPFTPVKRLSSIVGFHYSAIGQSHLPSVVDVILGSLRFAVNAHTRQQLTLTGSASKLLALISPLFWRAKDGEPVPELGITFSPKVIRASGFRAQYQGLKDFFAACGVSMHQEITDQRTY